MKIPKAPPDFLTIFHELARESPEALTKVVDASIKHGRQLDEYLPWDKVRYRKAHVTVETARQDLLALQEKGLLTRMKIGHGHAWVPAANIADRLRDM